MTASTAVLPSRGAVAVEARLAGHARCGNRGSCMRGVAAGNSASMPRGWLELTNDAASVSWGILLGGQVQRHRCPRTVEPVAESQPV
jgi:hypothetical protein